MLQNTPLERLAPTPAASTIRRLVSLTLALGGLLVLLGLGAVLPGLDRLRRGLAVSPGALLVAIVSLGVVVGLIWITPRVEGAVERRLSGPVAAVRNVAAAMKLLVSFTAVVLAYRGFQAVLIPLFAAFGLAGVYHLGFLVIGLFVLAAFARRLIRSWEPVTVMVADRTIDVVDTAGRGRSSTD